MKTRALLRQKVEESRRVMADTDAWDLDACGDRRSVIAGVKQFKDAFTQWLAVTQHQ